MIARPPKRRGSFGWPRIRSVVVGRDPDPLTTMELRQAAERLVAEVRRGGKEPR